MNLRRLTARHSLLEPSLEVALQLEFLVEPLEGDHALNSPDGGAGQGNLLLITRPGARPVGAREHGGDLHGEGALEELEDLRPLGGELHGQL